MHTVQSDIQFAVHIALEGREYLVRKWQGLYGAKYDKDVRDTMIKDYKNDIVRLREIRKKNS